MAENVLKKVLKPEPPEAQLVARLAEAGWKIATAESCTGGLIGATIVNVPGASDVFEQGLITYSNEAKVRLLGVNEATLAAYGAVSRETAGEMALGAARSAKAEVAISSTGIAGPGGGTPEKPVGLVYLACYVRGRVTVRCCHFQGSREEVRRSSVQCALELALRCLA